MELKEMTLQDVEARLASIDGEIEGATEVEAVNTLAEEKRGLVERQKELKDLAERKADAQKIAQGIEPGKLHEEEFKMEEKRTFAVDSVEYREAFLKNLQGKELDAEERAAVTASAAIPTVTMNKIIGILENVPLVAAVDMTYIPGNVTYPAENTVNVGLLWEQPQPTALTVIRLSTLLRTSSSRPLRSLLTLPQWQSKLSKIGSLSVLATR